MPKQIKDLNPTASLGLLDKIALDKAGSNITEYATIQQIQQADYFTIVSSGASLEIDLANGTNQKITLDENAVEITLPPVPGSGIFRSLFLALYQDATGGRVASWTVSGDGHLLWPDTDNDGLGDIPQIDQTANALTLYHFIGTPDGWIGSVVQGGSLQNIAVNNIILIGSISGGSLDYPITSLNDVQLSSLQDKDLLSYSDTLSKIINATPSDLGLDSQGDTEFFIPIDLWKTVGLNASIKAGALATRLGASATDDATRPVLLVREFAKDAVNRHYCYTLFNTPKRWSGQNFDARILWIPTTATSGNVRFGLNGTTLFDSSSIDTAALGADRETTDSNLGVDDIHFTSWISSIPNSVSSTTDNRLVYLQLYRESPDASDTYPDAVQVLGVQIKFQTDKPNDN